MSTLVVIYSPSGTTPRDTVVFRNARQAQKKGQMYPAQVLVDTSASDIISNHFNFVNYP